MWHGRYSIEAIAEERVRNSLRRTIWTRHSNVGEWDSKVADMEERYESAKCLAAASMDYAEKSRDHAERLGWMKD